jgi:hypothetical protein
MIACRPGEQMADPERHAGLVQRLPADQVSRWLTQRNILAWVNDCLQTR